MTSFMLTLLASGLLPIRAQARAVSRFAIVIGSNRPPDDSRPRLRYADDDAVSFHNLLVEAGVETTLLVDPDTDTRTLNPGLVHVAPRLSELERIVQRVAVKIARVRAGGGESELFFVYSGHGGEAGGEGYVLLDDGHFTRSMLFSLLTRLGSTRNHVIVDACKSSWMVIARGPGGRHRPYVGQPLARLMPSLLDNTGFILSTSSGRDSHEWERFHAGVLSHELRSALRGAADLDRNAAITYAEVGAFLARANSAIASRFRPDVMVRAPENDLRTSILRWASAPSIELDAGGWGHVYIECAHGDRLVDVHPALDGSISIWLPPERPLFIEREDEGLEYVIEDDAPRQVVELRSARPSRLSAKGALRLVFEPLFAEPFDVCDIAEFEETAPARQPSRRHQRAEQRRRSAESSRDLARGE